MNNVWKVLQRTSQYAVLTSETEIIRIQAPRQGFAPVLYLTLQPGDPADEGTLEILWKYRIGAKH